MFFQLDRPLLTFYEFINIEETKKLGTFEQFLEDSGLEEIIPNILSARKELVGFTPIEVPV